MSDPPPLDDPGDDRPDAASSPQVDAEGAGPAYQAGDIIAQKYKLVRLLGQGGMGAVWLAQNVKLEADVAIKLIRRDLGTPEAAHRLLQEARAAARIEHRSIVRVFDFGETELDDPFIVMEVLGGESLRALLERKGRLPAGNAVRTLLPLASALAEAHASGVVHRDLKPENVMLVPDKSGGVVPKLLDFGIAKFRALDEDAEDAASIPFAVGTPSYMAPEQAGGRDRVAEPADVWAMAVMLYESITGQVPFTGDNYAALAFAVMTAAPTPTTDKLAGDAELWALIEEALAKLQTERPTMRSFGASLAAWAMARGIDSDITGTSLAAQWGGEALPSPFSALPPPVMPIDEDSGEIALPRPAAVPRHAAITEAPPAPERPRERARGKRVVAGIAAAAALAAGLAFAATRGLSHVTTAATATASATATAPPVTSVIPAVTSTAAAPDAAPEPIPDPDTAPTTSATAPPPRPRVTPRKGKLPIAKQPNF